jgi:hypothetical protein
VCVCVSNPGVVDITREQLREDGKLDAFVGRVCSLFEEVFSSKVPIYGEDLPYAEPLAEIPSAMQPPDFTTCLR